MILRTCFDNPSAFLCQRRGSHLFGDRKNPRRPSYVQQRHSAGSSHTECPDCRVPHHHTIQQSCKIRLQVCTYLSIDDRSSDAPPTWRSGVTTCIVAQNDKKPLSIEHVEAIKEYVEGTMDFFGEEADNDAGSIIMGDKF